MTNKKIFQKDKKSIDFGPRIVYNIDSSKEHHKQVKEITTMTTIYTLFTEKVINATENILLTMDNNINLDETILDALAEIDAYLSNISFTSHIKGFRVEIEGFGEKVIRYVECWKALFFYTFKVCKKKETNHIPL